MDTRKIGFITIGQSPRIDLLPDIKKLLDQNIQIIEKGILDKYEYEEASKLFKPSSDDVVFVSRMKDGKQIKLGKSKIIPLIQESIDKMNDQDLSLIILLCTGHFPEFKSNILLIEPHDLIHYIVKYISKDKTIGLIVPDKEQVLITNELWRKSGVKFITKVASPYKKGKEIEKVAKEFVEENISFIFMDCMGYSIYMKEKVESITNKKVIIPRCLIASIANQFV